MKNTTGDEEKLYSSEEFEAPLCNKGKFFNMREQLH
jgi:hypothetical protein